jgi:hypothetical protein
MALKKTVTYRGIEIKDAYIRVHQFEGNKNSLRIGVSYHATADSELFDAQTFVVPYSVEGKNPLAQAYETIKAWDLFAGATDC